MFSALMPEHCEERDYEGNYSDSGRQRIVAGVCVLDFSLQKYSNVIFLLE